jgi:general secretion pathway protein G
MQATLERLRMRREEMGDEGGFTLIELLIVIVILGILAAIVVFAVQNLTGSSAQSACKSDFKTVETGIEAFNAQNGHYPTNVTDAGTPGSAAPYAAPTGFTVAATNLVGALMTAQPNGTGQTLRDFPGNGSHYQIAVLAGGKEQVLTPAGATVPAAGGTGTAADCTSVS